MMVNLESQGRNQAATIIFDMIIHHRRGASAMRAYLEVKTRR